jgi:DNA-binding NarL/FixJ family response regulator
MARRLPLHPHLSNAELSRRARHASNLVEARRWQLLALVADGKTNKDVGAALFLSHKTVEFHLSRIYRKLEINSRAELIRRFASEGMTPASTSA